MLVQRRRTSREAGRAGPGPRVMAKAKDVKVYLLNVEPALAGRVFYAEAPGDEAGEEDEATGHGLRGWAFRHRGLSPGDVGLPAAH